MQISGTAAWTSTSIDGTVVYDGAAQDIVNSTYENLQLTGGTKTSTGTLTVTDTLTNSAVLDAENVALNDVANTGTMQISGTAAWNSDSIGGTVVYDGANQTVVGSKYSNLTLSGTGTKTAGDAFSVDNTLTQAAGTVLDLNFATAGTEWNGAKSTMSGTVNYNKAGTLIADQYTDLNLNDNITANGAFGVSGSMTLAADKVLDLTFATQGNEWTAANSTLNGTVKYSGTAAQKIVEDEYTSLELTGGTKTATGTLTVTDTLTNSAVLDAENVDLKEVANSGTMKISGTAAWTSTSIGGTVVYDGAAQNIVESTYENLQLTGGTKTATGTLTVTATLTNSAVLDAENVALNNVANTGTMQISGTAAWNSDSIGGTVVYDGANQTVVGSKYSNLTLSGSGIKTAGDGFGVSNNLVLNNGVTMELTGATTGNEWNASKSTLNGDVKYSGTAAQTIVSDTYKNLSFSGSAKKAGSMEVTGDLDAGSVEVDFTDAATLKLGGTLSNYTKMDVSNINVNYNGNGAQTVAELEYGSLALSGSGEKTFNGDTDVNGNLTLTGAAVAKFGTNTITLGGSFTGATAANADADEAAFIYDGSKAQTVAALEYAELTLTGSGAKTANGDVKVGGTLTNSSTFNVKNVTAGTVDNSGTMKSGNVETTAGDFVNSGSFNGGNVTAAGAVSNSGSFTGGAVTATGDVTNNAGSTFKSGAINAAGVTNNGTLTGGNITTTANGVTNAGTLNSGNISAAGQAVVNDGTMNAGAVNADSAANSGKMTLSGAITVDTLTNNAGATLTLKADGNSWNSSAVGGTVVYDTVDQDLVASQYNDLILAGSGTTKYALDPAFAVAGTLTVKPNVTLVLGYQTTGTDWDASKSDLAGTVEYAADGSTVVEDTYTNLSFSGSPAVIDGDIVVTGALDAGNETLEFTDDSTLTLGGSISNYSNTDVSNIEVIYNGKASQSIASTTYGDLTLTNGDKTFAGDVVVNGTATIDAAASKKISGTGTIKAQNAVIDGGTGKVAIEGVNVESENGVAVQSAATVTFADAVLRGSNGYALDITAAAQVALNNTQITGNASGIHAAAGANVSLEGSAINGNGAAGTEGAGVYVEDGAVVTLFNTTVTGNNGSSALYAGANSTLNLINTTIAGNEATGVKTAAGSKLNAVNSILTHNYAGKSTSDLVVNGTANLISNVIGTASGVKDVAEDNVAFQYESTKVNAAGVKEKVEESTLFASYTTNANGNKVPVTSVKNGQLYIELAEKDTVANGGKYITLGKKNGVITGAAYSSNLYSNDFVTVFGTVDTNAAKVTTDQLGNGFVSPEYGIIGSVAAKSPVASKLLDNPHVEIVESHDAAVRLEADDSKVNEIDKPIFLKDRRHLSISGTLSTAANMDWHDDISADRDTELMIGENLDLMFGARNGRALRELAREFRHEDDEARRQHNYEFNSDNLDTEVSIDDLQLAVLDFNMSTFTKAEVFRDEFDEAIEAMLTMS